MNAQQTAVIDFWFRELTPAQWFEGGDPSLDDLIRRRFGDLLVQALAGGLDDWAGSPRGRLALIIVLDQFPRNIHRGLGESFAGDAHAQTLTLEGIAAGLDKGLNLAERQFFYMPLMHAEDVALQKQCVAQFEALKQEVEGVLGFATSHAAIIERFGRFPHRNDMLGRTSTPDEAEFILAEGRGF
jgi:uncharacterized protein (DUF924 family)